MGLLIFKIVSGRNTASLKWTYFQKSEKSRFLRPFFIFFTPISAQFGPTIACAYASNDSQILFGYKKTENKEICWLNYQFGPGRTEYKNAYFTLILGLATIFTIFANMDFGPNVRDCKKGTQRVVH